MLRRIVAVAIGAGMLMLSGCVIVDGAAGLIGVPLEIHGSFMRRADYADSVHHLYLRDGQNQLVADYTRADSHVQSWTPTTIRIDWPEDATSSWTVQVTINGDASDQVQLSIYDVTTLPLPSPFVSGTSNPPFPTFTDMDADGNLWVLAEFTSDLWELPAGESSWVSHSPATPSGFFRVPYYGGLVPSTIAVLHEDIAFDPDGDVWFTQGGSYTGDSVVNGRVLRYSPGSNTFRCYVPPINHFSPIGLVLDGDNVWVAASGADSILRFTPGLFSSGDTSCASPTPAPLCPNGSDACWDQYELPDPPGETLGAPSPKQGIGMMTMDSSGRLWWTSYLGHQVGYLDPSNGTFTTYNPPSTTRDPNRSWDTPPGPSPWSIVTGNNFVWVSEFAAGSVDRLNLLNSQWTRYPIPNLTATEGMGHTLRRDTVGRIWFTAAPGTLTASGVGSIGWVTDYGAMVWFPFVEPLVDGLNGFTVIGDGTDIYATHYLNKEIVHLARVE